MEPTASQAHTDATGDAGRSDEVLERLLYRRRLGIFGAAAKLCVPPLVISMLAILWSFWNDASRPVLVIWSFLLIILAFAFLVADRRFTFAQASVEEIGRHWQRFMVLDTLGVLTWASIFPYLALYAEGMQITLVALIGTGVLAGGPLVFRTAPLPGLVHVVVVSLSLMATVFIWGSWNAIPAIILIATFAALLLRVLRTLEKEFVQSAETEVARQEGSSLLRVLLNDYEEQSSDWLWTVDPQGNLRNVSERFASTLNQSPAQLEGVALSSLFTRDAGQAELVRHLGERTHFRDLLVQLQINGEVHYWRLSARPRHDGRMSGVARDVTADRLIEERVAFMAHYDNLTGLANRYLFNERLRELTSGKGEGARSFVLFYIDLDDFKAVNDMRGHLVGDRLLREVGTRLEQEVRAEDLVARLGGDEFAILIETRGGDGLLIERAHRFLSVVRAPYEIDGNTYRVSTSIGIARCLEGDCEAEELLRRADLALYAAKAKGRDNLALFEPSLDQEARERRQIEHDLGEALARGQMRMCYQPIVDLDSGDTVGFEALLRWHHPDRGVLSPGEFLREAEETGIILPLGEWVIRESLRDAAAMPGNLRIAINLSPTQVQSPSLVATVAQAIHATGIASERIEFEITEHVLMDQGEAGHSTLMRLRDLGVRIALDDFGTGYSSLAYLRRFPFDRIKIDRTFVTDVINDKSSQAIVSTITGLARALGMETTAEGIDDARQLDVVRQLGVTEAQGFLIARPMPPEQLFAREEGAAQPQVALSKDFTGYRKTREVVRVRLAESGTR